MVEIADINDRESLKAWLEETGQPREACIALAHRAAMRVMPREAEYFFQFKRRSSRPMMRALLVSGVASGAPHSLLAKAGHGRLQTTAVAAGSIAAKAADAAYSSDTSYAAAFAVADPTAARAANAAYVAVDAYGATSARTGEGLTAVALNVVAKTRAWAALRSDCQILAGNGNLFERSLWPDSLESSAEAWSRARTWMEQKGWEFWIDWYERALAGEPQPWSLLLEIALQEDAFWQGSDDEVMFRINEIVGQYEADEVGEVSQPTDLDSVELEIAQERSEYGEAVEHDAERNYVIRPLSDIPEDAFALAMRRVENTVDDIRETAKRSNSFFRIGLVANAVEKEVNRSADAPVLIYECLRTASDDIEYYCENDDVLSADADACRIARRYGAQFMESAYELRVYDQRVRAALDAKSEFDKDSIAPVERDEFLLLTTKIRELSAGRLAEDMESDPQIALDESASPEERRSALYRLGSRIVRIVILDRQSMHDMAAAVTLLGYAQSQGLITALAQMIRWFLP